MVPNYHRSSLKSLVSLCLCCQSAILTYERAFSLLNLLYCTCPASKDSISPNYYNTHTYSNTHIHTKHTWGNIPQGKSSISFMAFSGKVSSSPIKRLHSTLLLLLYSLSYISICISFGSHLRTIHSGQLTSTIFPFFPIPPRDNWSKLESGIFASTIRDKTSATGFPLCPQFARQ